MLAAYRTYSAVYCAPPCFSCVDALASGAPFHLLMSGVHVTNAGGLNCRRVTVDILGTFLFVRVGWMRILAAAPYLTGDDDQVKLLRPRQSERWVAVEPPRRRRESELLMRLQARRAICSSRWQVDRVLPFPSTTG